MNDIAASIGLCALSLLLTLLSLRSTGLSLGLPLAYLFILYLNHVPGAYAHLIRPELFTTTEYVTRGIWQTAIASMCFFLGLYVARVRQQKALHQLASPEFSNAIARSRSLLDNHFLQFCLFGGWSFVYVLTPLQSIPSLGAMIEKGGTLWMLGVMLGLRTSIARSDWWDATLWLSALAVYPVLMLLLGGFLSYGSAAAIIVVSVAAVSARSYSRAIIAMIIIIPIGLSVFVNYFIARDEIRSVAWSSASFSARVSTVINAFAEILPLNLEIDKHAEALDARLNQNYFAGLAAYRLENGLVDYRGGISFYEASIAPIPRAFWPDKPVYGGSGSIVRDMTGLELNEETSWGVGQVMEFYINFGWPSLILGFLVLGWLIGRLDIKAAVAEREGDVRTLFTCFLPAVALIQPIGSLVELVGGALAAYIAAIGWFYGWKMWRNNRNRRHAVGKR